MKITYALALAATVEQATATFGIGGDIFKYWTGVQPFTCPGKQPTICTPGQVPGYDWKDTPVGPIGGYGGCSFKGWTCKKKFGRRDMLAGRQDDGSKVIEADVGAEGANANPTISAGSEIGTFDIDSFSVESEFDARFEFHYTMPDGSICKQSSPVSSQGTSIVNTQCGGAKSVTLVLPENQEGNQKRTFGLLKKLCKVKCHKIKFWCKPPPVKTTTRVTPPAQTTTKYTPPAQTTTVTTVETTTTPATETSVKTTSKTTSFETTTPGKSTETSKTTSVETTTPGKSTETTSVETSKTTSVETTTPGQSTETSKTTSVETTTPPGTTPGQTTPPVVTITTTDIITTTYQTTSTVFTTTTKTITSCGPEITSCPIKTPGGTHIVTITVPVSTTICPVTETRPVVVTTTALQPTESKPSETQPGQTTDRGNPTESKTSPPVPSQSLPCPDSVPRCLNSWLDLVKECKNNADAACFCKNSEFTKNVFNCLYSYGGSDKNVADSITFFQGICAPYAGKNPNIVTGAETITKIITVTPTAQPSGAVTTITIDTTVTEPCVTSGTTIPGSSTTRVISTQVPVPQVTFTPPPAGEKEPAPGGEVLPTTAAPGLPVGTGAVTKPSGTPPLVVNGAGKVQTGLLGLVAMVVVAAL